MELIFFNLPESAFEKEMATRSVAIIDKDITISSYDLMRPSSKGKYDIYIYIYQRYRIQLFFLE